MADDWTATIRATDVPDRYDLWDGDELLLARAPMAEIGHLLQHGGRCPEGCENCP